MGRCSGYQRRPTLAHHTLPPPALYGPTMGEGSKRVPPLGSNLEAPRLKTNALTTELRWTPSEGLIC